MSFEKPVSLPNQENSDKSSKISYHLKKLALLGALAVGHSPETKLSSEDKLDIAKQEMTERGITSEQRGVYKPGISEFLRKAIDPSTSYDIPSQIRNISNNWNRDITIESKRVEGITDNDTAEDAWRLYLGMPQRFNSFSISDYRPSKGTDDKFYYKLNNLFSDELLSASPSIDSVSRDKLISEKIKTIVESIDNHNGSLPHLPLLSLGHFSFTKGIDNRGSYIAYYDKWDLDVPIENEIGLVGKPFEIYDRIYYDPTTFEPISVDTK